MAQNSSLDGLPPALFEIVTEHLQPDDLRCLRLVNRECASKALRTFAKVWFAQKSFLLCDADSLEVARGIARHAAYGPALRKIVLFVDELGDWERLYDIQSGDIVSATEINDNETTLEDFLPAWEYMKLRQDKFRGSCRDYRLLKDTFKALERYGKLEKVVLENLGACRNPRPLTTKRYDVFNDLGLIPPRYDDYRPLSIVVEALGTSVLRPKSFIMNTHSWFPLLTNFSKDSRFLEMCSKVFQSVENLAITLSALDDTEKYDVTLFLSTFMTSKVLKNLHLISADGDDVIPDRIYDHYNFDIETFNVFESEVSFDTTTAFCTLLALNDMPALRELELRGHGFPGWHNVASFVRRHSEIQKIKSYIWYPEGDDQPEDWDFDDEDDWKHFHDIPKHVKLIRQDHHWFGFE